MARFGIGPDGYLRVQKETTYGTPLTNSMSALPLRGEYSLNYTVSPIERANLISSRYPQKPAKGRIVGDFEFSTDIIPSIVGQSFQFFLGAASSGAAVDSTYTHQWLFKTTGNTAGYPFTIQEAVGSELADTYTGAIINEIKIQSDSEGLLTQTMTGAFKDRAATNVARVGTLVYPSASPMTFANLKLYLTPNGSSEIEAEADSVELTMTLGNEEGRFKVGDQTSKRPLINGAETLSLKVSLDADRLFREDAILYTDYSARVVILATEYAGGTTPFKTEIIIPKLMISPETEIKRSMEMIKQDLEFMAHTGGTTANTGANTCLAEIRVTDASAAWA